MTISFVALNENVKIKPAVSKLIEISFIHQIYCTTHDNHVDRIYFFACHLDYFCRIQYCRALFCVLVALLFVLCVQDACLSLPFRRVYTCAFCWNIKLINFKIIVIVRVIVT